VFRGLRLLHVQYMPCCTAASQAFFCTAAKAKNFMDYQSSGVSLT